MLTPEQELPNKQFHDKKAFLRSETSLLEEENPSKILHVSVQEKVSSLVRRLQQLPFRWRSGTIENSLHKHHMSSCPGGYPK
jgi:hypothetical protein